MIRNDYVCENQMTIKDYFRELENSYQTENINSSSKCEKNRKFNITAYIPEGCKNAISRKELCIATGLKDRVVRNFIEDARRTTIIISNYDGSGYWIYPNNPTDEEKELLNKYVKQQEHRAKSIFYALYPARQMLKGGAMNGGGC